MQNYLKIANLCSKPKVNVCMLLSFDCCDPIWILQRSMLESMILTFPKQMTSIKNWWGCVQLHGYCSLVFKYLYSIVLIWELKYCKIKINARQEEVGLLWTCPFLWYVKINTSRSYIADEVLHEYGTFKANIKKSCKKTFKLHRASA